MCFRSTPHGYFAVSWFYFISIPPPPTRRSGRAAVLVVALLQGGAGDALGRPPLVHAQQGVQQVVDVGLQALPLHPALQQVVHLVPRRRALRQPDVVVADADEPEELVVDPHVQVLVEEVEALPQRLL